MNKKTHGISVFLLLLFTFTLMNSTVKMTENITSKPSSVIIDNKPSNNNDDIDENNNVNNDIKDQIIKEIKTEEPQNKAVEIIEVIENKSEYIAIGSKDGQSFLQIFELINNQLNIKEKAIDLILKPGRVKEVVRKNLFLTATVENNSKESTQDFFISNDKIIPYYKKQINLNYSKGVKLDPKYLVIHETNNTNIGADAEAHFRYWNSNPQANASTHFVVDNKEIYQMLEFDQVAWQVGDNKGYSDITNFNSIGIEIAVNADGNYEEARQHAIELSIQIMKELNMDISQLKRHYDASGKKCPLRMIEDPSLWTDFVNQVKIGLEA